MAGPDLELILRVCYSICWVINCEVILMDIYTDYHQIMTIFHFSYSERHEAVDMNISRYLNIHLGKKSNKVEVENRITV